MRILKRILQLALLTVLLTACALLATRYFFADQLITAALQRAGATEVHYISRLGSCSAGLSNQHDVVYIRGAV